MSTVVPSRPVPSRPSPARSRPSPAASRAASIDPFRVLRRHLLGLIAAGIFGAILGVLAFFLFDRYYPLYSEQATFLIQPGVGSAGDIGTDQRIAADEIERIANTQIVLIRGREVLGDALGTSAVRETQWYRDNYIDASGSHLVQEAIDDLAEDLDAEIIRDTQLFAIRFSTHNKSDVPTILNAIADSFIAHRKKLDSDVFIENHKLFSGQLTKTSNDLSDIKTQIEDLIIETGLTSLSDVRYSQPALSVENLTSQISNMQSMLNLRRTGLEQTNAKLRGTMEFTAEDLREAETDPSVNALIQAVVANQVELHASREKFPPDHPVVREAETRLRAAESIKASKTQEVIRRNLESRQRLYSNEVESVRANLDQLEEKLETEDKKLNELTAQQSQLESLQSQRDHLEQARDNDLQLLKEIDIMRLRADASRVRLAQRAPTPRVQSFPLPQIVIPLGMLIMLALTVGIIFLRELTDQRVKSASDLSVLPNVQVLGVIPELGEDPTKAEAAEAAIRRFPNSVVAESYRQATAPIARAIDRAGHQTIVIVGGLPGAGTTSAVSNIASSLAASGRNVLVVDSNFRRPRLAEVMGVERDRAGFGDLLDDAVTLDEVIAQVEPGLSVVAAGTPASRIIDRLGSEKFDRVVAEMRGRFDVVIFDAPPAVVAGDAMVLANNLDASVLVVRANREQRGLVARLVHQFGDAHSELLGILLNRPRGTAGGYFKKNFKTMASYTAKA